MRCEHYYRVHLVHCLVLSTRAPMGQAVDVGDVVRDAMLNYGFHRLTDVSAAVFSCTEPVNQAWRLYNTWYVPSND